MLTMYKLSVKQRGRGRACPAHGRTGVEGRHLDGPIAQIPDELCAAGESVGVYLHDGFFFLWYFYGKGSFFVGRA